MKKFLAIVLAVVMICAITVTAAAEEVLFSEDTKFWDAGNWTEYDITDTNFFELLNNENALLVITRSKETHIEFTETTWEKFCLLESWWGGVYPNATDETCQWIQLGTAGHTSAEEASILVDCVSDDGVKVAWPAKKIYDILVAGGGLEKGNPHFICNEGAGEGIYSIVNVSIVVPDTPVEAAPETTPEATPAAPAETTPEAAPATTPDAPKTGLALAVVPAVMALAAVAVSKKH